MIRVQILSDHNYTICKKTELNKVSMKKFLVRSNLVQYKLHNTNSIPKNKMIENNVRHHT